jgi:ADP-ribose pyrophosphatase YjhB (NUDIX family)
MNSKNSNTKQVTRVGVYAVVMKDDHILLIKQKKGPYTGKLDFPGGGMEFGESPEEALRRELVEEVAMEFKSYHLIDNLTATLEVSATPVTPAYTFYQIGMIYQVEGAEFVHTHGHQELEHFWVDLNQLSVLECSRLLWAYRIKIGSQKAPEKGWGSGL